jgi:hypothetical protein
LKYKHGGAGHGLRVGGVGQRCEGQSLPLLQDDVSALIIVEARQLLAEEWGGHGKPRSASANQDLAGLRPPRGMMRHLEYSVGFKSRRVGRARKRRPLGSREVSAEKYIDVVPSH